MQTTNTEMNTETVNSLNELLRGELSAVETYTQALTKMQDHAGLMSSLEKCRMSHERRVSRLAAAVSARGGEPAESSGAWGAFARMVEGGAKLLGKDAAIAALEEGEDHGLKEYREALAKLDFDGRSLIADELLPEQADTHDIMSRLKKQQRS